MWAQFYVVKKLNLIINQTNVFLDQVKEDEMGRTRSTNWGKVE
jgi:hypothetical protein